MSNSPKKGEALHLGIAERGKMFAVEGKHPEALRYYREAIRLSVQNHSPEIFFQHYLQCVMESLEKSGAHHEVIEYCEKALGLLEKQDLSEDTTRKLYGSTLEKMAVQYLLLGESETALVRLQEARKTTGPKVLPLADQLLGWVERRYAITPKQIREAQQRHRYFVVRKEQINPKIAIELPKQAAPIL